MENVDRENIDELLEIRQYFPRQNFGPYGTHAYFSYRIQTIGACSKEATLN